MAKSDQTIKVVLSLDGVQRELVSFWRKGLDYFSAIAGKPGHSAYHQRGRTHVKLKPWGGEDYYQDVEHKVPSALIEEVHILQGLVFKYDKCFLNDDSPFNKYHGKKADIVIQLDGAMFSDSTGLIIISGLAPTKYSVLEHFSHIEPKELLILERLEILEKISGPVMFLSILRSHQDIDRELLSEKLFKLIQFNNVFIPRQPNYIVAQGQNITWAIKYSNPIKWAEPIHDKQPYLPIRVHDWMPKHDIYLTFQGKNNGVSAFCKAGSIAIMALPHQCAFVQRLLVIPSRFYPFPKIEIDATDYRVKAPSQSECIYFEFGVLGGHAVKQIRLDGYEYQIKLNRVYSKKSGYKIATGLLLMKFK